MNDIQIEEDLYDRIERRAEKYDFESADAYAEQILVTVLTELDGQSKEDDAVTDRLEDLGYL